MSEERKIRNIAEYLKEVSKMKEGWSTPVLAFRGQKNAGWLLASSAERRLQASSADQERVNKELFIEYHQNLLTRCKLKNYHQREGKPLDDLELLADLQHHGAATCLLDFTRNALVALWIACEKSDTDGKVFVVNTADGTTFLEITPTDIENNSISDILEFKTRETSEDQTNNLLTQQTITTSLNEPNFWYWSPAHLNERITAQHSLFLFGSPSSMDLRLKPGEIVIESVSKDQIRRELKDLHDIHEESLFPDFIGFAYTQRHNAPYDMPSAEEYLRRGAEALQRGQDLEAIAYCTKAIDLRPDFTNAYGVRGMAFLAQDELDHSLKDFTKAIELEPDSAGAHYGRGTTYVRQGKTDLAIQDLIKTLELDPDSADAYYERGVAYSEQNDFTSAIEDFTKAIELDPDITNAYFYRACAYGSQDKHDRALPDFTMAIALKPDFAEAYYNRGITYGSLGDVDSTIEDYTKAIILKPDFADAYYNRGEAWLYLGEWEKAKSDLTSAENAGADIIALFHVIYKDIVELEQKIGAELPEDIASMLTEKPQ